MTYENLTLLVTISKSPLGFSHLKNQKRIIFDLVEKKPGLLSEKELFSWGSANRGNPLWPNGSMPGQQGDGSERPTNLHDPGDTHEP